MAADLTGSDRANIIRGRYFLMAKISKKTPQPNYPKGEIVESLTNFMEGMEDPGLPCHHEPITHIPNVDMFSTASELIIEVELPGVRKEDIEVSQSKNTLTIKALKFECFEDEKINYVCMERSFGRLFRTIEMPFPVNTVNIKATFNNGVLMIVVPRVEDKRSQTKRIQIES